MATLRCKSCGRVYSYEKNGTCPKCGAYNRPPRKEVVEADGTIRYVTTENKVCYEEKECHEEEVRQSVSSYSYTPETPTDDKENSEQDNVVKTLWQHRNAVATAGKQKKVVAVLAIISAVCSFVGVLMGNLSSRHSEPVYTPWEDVSVEPAGSIYNLASHVGGTIYTDSGTVTIDSYEQVGSELAITLITKFFDFDLTLDCYYETPTECGYLEMLPPFSDGERYTFVATLPDGITAADCAAVLDVPFEAGINRYWVWLETPTYEMGEAFFYCGQRVYVDSWEQVCNEVQVNVCAEDEAPIYSEAGLTVLNAAEQPYTVYWYGIQSRDLPFIADSKLRFDFTLRNENDTVQSITFCDNAGNYRQFTVNLR